MKAYFIIIAVIFMPLSGMVINHQDNHVRSYIFGMIKAVHTLVFTCTYKEAAKGIKQLSSFNTFMKIVNLKSSKCMEALFTPKVHAKTSIFIDCRCIEAGDVLHKGSNGMFFNKTYQWMLWDAANKCLPLLYKLKNIGPNAQLIKYNKTPRIRKLLEKKVLPHRGPKDLPVYTHLEDALPYVKKGGHAFHCEVVDAYPEIAKQFDVSEICDLRVVFGLLESELLNFVIHKNSPFTEIFRIVMRRAVETGLDKRILKQRQPEKPPCSNLYTVYPVDLTGTFSAFIFLAGAIVSSLVLCCIEGLFKVQVQVFKCQLQ
ncbi:uncharacterized protein LOC101888976 isoform X4 [Musca domestica]|uniref:Uncharacterized protein LOC101888976 isoform X4 n=1 Tax=Musca domestica TaxID=7370 RepID=A0ABM3VK83_MUSDO|nr:uncharacterized protein LOC101888976 isoform X4 [Musca domestica]